MKTFINSFGLLCLLFVSNSGTSEYVWVKTWGTSAGFSVYQFEAMAEDGSDNVYVTGSSRGSIFLLKLNSDGTTLWELNLDDRLGYNSGYDIGVDNSGNIFVIGSFAGSVDFDPGPGLAKRSPRHTYDIFICKYDTNGEFQWARTWGGLEYPPGSVIVSYILHHDYCLTFDVLGHIYMAGTLRGDSYDFDQGTRPEVSLAQSAFLCKLDHDGKLIWSRVWENSLATDIIIDHNSGIYVTGAYWNTVDFDPGMASRISTSNGSDDVFLSKFSTDGEFIWSRTWGGAIQDMPNGLTMDADGNVYVTGNYWDRVDFNPGPGVAYHESNGDSDAFLSKFDSHGNFEWVETWGGPNVSCSDESHSLAIDSTGNIYVTGWSWCILPPNISVLNDRFTNVQSTTAYLMCFDTEGSLQWKQEWGGNGHCWARDICIDRNDKAYITGSFLGTVDFNTSEAIDEHLSVGDSDGFIIKFNL